MKNTNQPNKPNNVYDDDNIPEIDLPRPENQEMPAEPLPEYTRPRKDGPGGA